MTEATEDGRTIRASAQRENRRTEILDAALQLFGRKGYHGTHVSDIIDGAGIARGTFYLYFESKSAIFLELLDRMMQELRSNIVGVEAGPGRPPMEAQLVDTVHRILNTVHDNRLLTGLIVREAVGLGEEVDERLREFYASILTYIRDALEEGQRIGIVREFDTEIASMCILGTIKQFMEQIVVIDPSRDVDIDRMALAVLDFSLRGVLQPRASRDTTR